jgi:chromosome segregation ATPase
MPQIIINALKINVITDQGPFQSFIKFTTGLNIVRAKNSTGKSSLMNSVLYALGVEELLGGTNGKTMKPVLRDELRYQTAKHKVLESNIELQITNENNETITIRRWIISTAREERLVEIEFGPSLTTQNKYARQDYYVHYQGSAQNESGFHSFLAQFIGWNIPLVPSFDGKERLLYIQTLFPLFFVEQLKGWSSFYAQPSTNYGIRELSTRAIEFLLGLDVLKNNKLKEELRIEKILLSQEWSSLTNSIREKANGIGAIVEGLPSKPELLLSYAIYVYDKNQNLVNLIDKINESIREFNERANVIRNIQDVEDEHEQRIENLENKVLALQSEASFIRQEINSAMINNKTLEENISQLEHDLKSNQDAKKLFDLGSDKNLYVAKGICPTCNQKIHETLLPQDIEFQPMSLEENIKFIKDQIYTC